MIRAIIFDCFGVLATDGWLPFKDEHFGHDKDLYAQASDLNKQADSGLLNYDKYVHEIALLAAVSDAEVQSNLGANKPNEPLFEFISESLKPNFKLGLLSNSGGDWLSRMFSDDQVGLFDAIVLSYQVGFTKPDARMYETIAVKLGVETNECIFIDDQERYCTGAVETGMQAVQYKTTNKLKADLKDLLT